MDWYELTLIVQTHPFLQEVADVDGKYALISAVAEISEGVAGMAVDEGATRRPRRSNAYTAFRRVRPLPLICGLPCGCASWGFVTAG